MVFFCVNITIDYILIYIYLVRGTMQKKIALILLLTLSGPINLFSDEQISTPVSNTIEEAVVSQAVTNDTNMSELSVTGVQELPIVSNESEPVAESTIINDQTINVTGEIAVQAVV